MTERYSEICKPKNFGCIQLKKVYLDFQGITVVASN